MATLLEQMYRGAGLSAPYSAKTKDRFARQAGYTPLDTGGADYYSPATNKKPTAYSAAKPKTTSKEKYGNSLSVPASMFDEENKKRNKLNYIVNENYQMTKGWGTSNPYSQLDYINEDERLIVSDYVAQKEYDSAYRYLESISSQLDRRQADSEYKQTVDFAKKYPITATAVSSVNSAFKPIELGVNIAQFIDNKNAGKSTAFDPNSQNFSTSRYSAAVNEGLMADSNNIERILKNAGISLANQQAVRGIVGTGLLNELFMAAQVAQDSLYENSKNNLSGEDALVNSFGKGAIAYWTERFFPSEKLMGVKLSDLQDSLLESIKKSSMSEGFEEVMENVLSNIWDTAQLGDKSEISQLVVAYRERGYSKHSAMFRTFMKKYVFDSRESFFTGALSGGVAHGVNTVANSVLNYPAVYSDTAIVKKDKNAYNVYKGGEYNGEEDTESGKLQQIKGENGASTEIRVDGRRFAENRNAEAANTPSTTEAEGRKEKTINGKNYSYNTVGESNQSLIAAQTKKAFESIGIKADIYDGELFIDGKARGKKASVTTFDNGDVIISNNSDTPVKEAIAHDGFHAYLKRGNQHAKSYYDSVLNNFDITSESAEQLIDLLTDNYNGDVTEEIAAYYSGWLNDENADGLSLFEGCFIDENDVKESHRKFIESIKTDASHISKSGYGAYTALNDPYGEKRDTSAENFYKQILNRNRQYEIEAVAKNTGFSVDDIDKVYAHIFELKHLFEDGRVERFAPDYYMQQSWMRLRDGKNIKQHDITLIKHELAEAEIMSSQIGITYEKVHAEVQKKYNYKQELLEYLKNNDA